MPDYQNGKVYKVCDTAYKKCYIGSTVETLSSRMSKHRSGYKDWLCGKRNKVMVFDIFDEYGIDNCKIELIESFPCANKEELEAREGYHQLKTDCVNKNIAGNKKHHSLETFRFENVVPNAHLLFLGEKPENFPSKKKIF